MKIKMEKSMNGATSALGNVSMVYEEGQTYDMSSDWQQAIAEAFISTDAAKEVSISREKKVDAPTEKQAETDAPKKKSTKK